MRPRERRRCECGHVWVHHTNDPHGCWGPECLHGSDEVRCREWRPVDPPEPKLTPRKKKEAARVQALIDAEARLKDGSLAASVFRLAGGASAEGVTVTEAADKLTVTPVRVVAAVAGLVEDGLLVDAGVKRPDSWGTPEVAYRTWANS